MSNLWVFLAVTILIIAASAFFVAIEFALLAAKRHRLEDAAATSRSARAALRSSSELTVLLAGSQLGITLCVLALGATSKPAVHYWLTPILEDWGWAYWVADATGFVLALVLMTFLHLVVGEMAPKSWAIAHPERSATLLAVPMRGFMFLTRPMLKALNGAANRCLLLVGVQPVDQVAGGQNSDDLRHLVEHSADVGSLDVGYSSSLSRALQLQDLTVGDLLAPGAQPTAVRPDARVGDVHEAVQRTGHLRILVGDGERVDGVVHVRDTLTLDPGDGLGDLVREPLTLASSLPVHTALATMRETSQHLAVVQIEDGSPAASAAGPRLGVVTLDDVLRRLIEEVPEAAVAAAERD